MKIVNIALCLALCIATACASSGGYNHYPSLQREDASDDERALAYSLNLLSKITDYTSTKVTDNSARFQPSEIPLSVLGLDSSGSPKKVSDLFDTVHMKLSDSYKFTFGDGSSTENGGKDMMNIPFDNVFTLSSSSIHYISNVLATLSHLDTVHARSIAPMFGVGGKTMGSSENLGIVAKLLHSIAEMDPSSRGYVVKASIRNNGAETDDPLSKHVQLFSLASLASMEKKRVEKVTDFFDSINHIHEEDIAKYFYSIGWKIKDSRKEQSSINMADRIPNPSIMFLVQDATLTQMAQTASQYSSSTGGAHVEDVKQAVENNLHHVRDFLDFIPGYSTISSLIDLTNNPIVNAISQIISLSYKYPTASYLQLVLIYYRDIGMPGLQGIMDYPSQYVGSIASSVVGGYVSNAIAGVVTELLFPSATAISASADSTTAMSSTTLPSSLLVSATAQSSANPISSSSSSSSSGGGGWWPWSPSQSTSSDTTSMQSKVTPTASNTTSSSTGEGGWWPWSSAQNSNSDSSSPQPKATPITSTTTRSATGGGGWWPWSPSQSTNSDIALPSQPKVTPVVPAGTSKPSLVSVASSSTSVKGNTYQATLDLNKQSSTRVIYTLSQNTLPTLILTVIPQHL